MRKIIPIILLFLGESLAIYSEVVAAKSPELFGATFWKMCLMMAGAGMLLIAGYVLGMKYIDDIWVVGTVSIASIIIAEPLITYFIFRELPTKGPLIGLVLAVAAIFCAVFIK